MASWADAVVSMGKWYEKNVHCYENWHTVPCDLLNGGQIRRDCSGYVCACLRLFGVNVHTNSGGFASNERVAQTMQSAGFVKLPFNQSILQAFDIYTHAQQPGAKFGHVEICAGPGKQWGWGGCHDGLNGHAGMPCGATKYSAKHPYSHIWRHSSMNNMTPEQLAQLQAQGGTMTGMGFGGGAPGGHQKEWKRIREATPEEIKQWKSGSTGTSPGSTQSGTGGSMSTNGPAPSVSKGSKGSTMDAKACLEFLHMMPNQPGPARAKGFHRAQNVSGWSSSQPCQPQQAGYLCSTFTKLAAMYGMGAFTWQEAIQIHDDASCCALLRKCGAGTNGNNPNSFAGSGVGSTWHGYKCIKSGDIAGGAADTVEGWARSGQVNPTDIFRIKEGSGSHVFMWGGDQWVSDYLQGGKAVSTRTRRHYDWYRFQGSVINMPSGFSFNTSNNVGEGGAGGGGGDPGGGLWRLVEEGGKWWYEEAGYTDENGNWVKWQAEWDMMGGFVPWQPPPPEPLTYDNIVKHCPEDIEMKNYWVRQQLQMGEHSQTLHDMWYYVPQGLDTMFGTYTGGGDMSGGGGGDGSFSGAGAGRLTPPPGFYSDQALWYMISHAEGTVGVKWTRGKGSPNDPAATDQAVYGWDLPGGVHSKGIVENAGVNAQELIACLHPTDRGREAIKGERKGGVTWGWYSQKLDPGDPYWGKMLPAYRDKMIWAWNQPAIQAIKDPADRLAAMHTVNWFANQGMKFINDKSRFGNRLKVARVATQGMSNFS